MQVCVECVLDSCQVSFPAGEQVPIGTLGGRCAQLEVQASLHRFGCTTINLV